MIEPLNSIRLGSVTRNPSDETRMAGCKKTKKKKLWGCALLRRSRANSDPGPTATGFLIHNDGEKFVPPECPSLSSGTSVRTKNTTSFKQPRSPTEVAYPACDTDFYDGSPKIWKQSQKFFSDDYIMHHKERNSATPFQEDTKIWLEDLARKSKLARDRFNQKRHHNLSTLNSGDESLAPVAPFRLTATKAKPGQPLARKSCTRNHGICEPARSNVKSDFEFGHSETMQLNIPHLQKLRRSESPSSFSVTSEGVNRSWSSVRLVSAWSSDTLSLLAADNPENGNDTSLESLPASAEEETISMGANARRIEAN
ncbi:hypothetical protein PCASD_03019 [Puccinia coronata f. sp. avenae]|uniref:Uncharacterized protein n=1 Tax=Puccinia coronata f. sp. avenae TaxID=200324 RepID=A0A2N5VGS4_9BASI|nr:hypothetical protein PCASD_03019 [Puccinia coronata f. sp. avenae]